MSEKILRLKPDEVAKLFAEGKMEVVNTTLPVFSKESRLSGDPMIERAKELDQFLILRVNETPDGQPLTMKKIQELLQIDAHWYRDEDFFTQDVPRVKWALVSKNVIPNSTGKNYLQQTEVIVDYLKTKVFKGQLPKEFAQAITEFETKKASMAERIRSNSARGQVAKELSDLKLTQLTRQSPVEVLYDFHICWKNKNESKFRAYLRM